MNDSRFTRLDELGRGAMGVVWRAADHADGGRIVALKTIRAEAAITSELRLQFKEEFRAMARLRHPNTLEVYDYGELDDHTQFITMELVPGRELADLVAAGPLPVAEVLRVLAALLQALGFIHSRLLVHRDIKAANVRIRDDGTIKLMDFGLMAQLGLPSNGKISGTPGYLAPEVARGGTIDQRADLYALGCLAYEMLVGQVPFTGRVIDVVRAHVQAPPPPLDRLRPDLPAKLVAIVHRLLEKDPAARHADAAAVLDDLVDLAGPAAARPTLEQRKSYLVAGTLVGRDAELATLMAALADARAGRGRAIYVEAPAGVGKSRLVHEAALAAKLADLPVLASGCHEAGMAPYEGVLTALRGLEAIATPEERGALDGLLADLARAGLAGAEGRRARAADVGAALAAVARRTPLVWVVEDVHWADAGTIDVLNHVVGALAAVPLLVIVTRRGDETPAGSAVLAPLAEGLATPLDLAPFDGAGVRALVAAMLGPADITPAYARYFVEATGGNAFFVTEALRAMMEDQVLAWRDGSWRFPTDTGNLALLGTIQATVARRLARLGAAARRVAEAAAVIGPAPSRELLLAIAEVGEDELFAALDELIERQFLVKDGAAYRFPHDRVRETLHAELEPGRRARLHGRCGEALAARADVPLAVLARHFAEGPDRERAFAYARRAGDAARDAGAPESALAHWEAAERALLAGPRGVDDPRLADLWWDVGKTAFYARPAAAIVAFERLVERLECLCHATFTSRLLLVEIKVARRLPAPLRNAFFGVIERKAGAAYAAAPGRFNPMGWAHTLSRSHQATGYLAVALTKAGYPRRGEETLARAVHMLSFEGTGTVLEAAQVVITAAIQETLGRVDEAIATARRAVAMVGPPGTSDHPLARVARVGAFGLQLAVVHQGERPDPALLEVLEVACHEAGDLHGFGDAWAHVATWHARAGRLDEAAAWIDRIAQHARKHGEPVHPEVLFLRPYLAFQAGDHETALGLARQGLAAPQLVGGRYAARARLALLEARCRLALGEAAAAAAAFDALLADARARELGLDEAAALLGRAEAAIARGDAASARADLDAVRARSATGPWRNPRFEGAAARLLGELATREGRWADAEADLARALAIADAQENALVQGHVHRALGALHAARGDREAAEAAYRVSGERYYALRNRHHLHLVTGDLEAVRREPAPAAEAAAVVPAAPPPQPTPEAVMERWSQLMRL